MDYACSMRGGKGARKLIRDCRRTHQRQSFLSSEELIERFALEQVHHDERDSFGPQAVLDHSIDVTAIAAEPRGDLSFLKKPRAHLCRYDERSMEKLYRDTMTKRDVNRFPHRAHRTMAAH